MHDKTAAGTKTCAERCSAQEAWLERLTTVTLGLCRSELWNVKDKSIQKHRVHRGARKIVG